MRKCPRKKFAGGVGIVLRFFLDLVTSNARNTRSKDKNMANIFFSFIAMSSTMNFFKITVNR